MVRPSLLLSRKWNEDPVTIASLPEKAKFPPDAPAIRPVILCGGSGTRLWPISRTLLPKQLLSLAGEGTMLQATVRRTSGDSFGAPVLITGEEHRFLVKEQIAPIGSGSELIILEPGPRNTGPAVALAAFREAAENPDQLMLVMPSDHVIGDVAAFHDAVSRGRAAASEGAIVTFGVKADRPETGYGYIEAGDELQPGVLDLVRFTEKPDADTARTFIASGHHFWNGGIFLFKAQSLVDEMRTHAPEIAAACEEAIAKSSRDGAFLRPDSSAFERAPSISLDYAVMEQTARGAVVPVDMAWSDVGSWDALWAISPKDADGNVLSPNVSVVDTRNSLIRSDGAATVAALGISDLVVVATRDAVLIMPRDRSEEVKLLLDQLARDGVDRMSVHTQVFRPWGSYEVMDQGDRFQTKRIIVKPGEKLSLQMHHQRSEHWVVVSGTARVTVNEDVRLLQESESTYVPAGAVHRLENPGKIPLHLIEVQCGPYLGEDDIVRLEDNYGRLAGQ
jgi:mannose-1-phosphate guanylyltransferase/mannose-6-phosphate isomerase